MARASRPSPGPSSFKRADTSATPAAGKDDATATATIEGVYTAGLDNLKKVLETK